MSKVVRVAVVGYGGMGGWHTKRLQEIPGVVELARRIRHSAGAQQGC